MDLEERKHLLGGCAGGRDGAATDLRIVGGGVLPEREVELLAGFGLARSGVRAKGKDDDK